MSEAVRRLPVMPQSIEAEQAVIGSLLIESNAWPAVSGTLGPTDFYDERHQHAYAAIADLRIAGRATDAVTVAEQMGRHGHDGDGSALAFLARIARDTPTAANVCAYAELVRERAALRGLRALGTDLTRAIDEGRDRTAEELAATAQERLLALRDRLRPGRGLVRSKDLVGELLDDLDRRREGRSGLSVGLDDFDRLTCGLEPGDLAVLAGRPGMGKTALLVSIAAHVARTTPVAVFSAEMPAQQLMRRCVALLSGVSQGKLRRAEKLTPEDWTAIGTGACELAERRIWIDETPLPALAHVRAELTGLKARENVGLVVIDYIQLLTGNGANRYEQLRDVAYGLKALAKDLAVPVVVLAQLNRGVESREGKRPHVSDLRDSGAIEEAADIVGLLFSEGYYDAECSMAYVLECAIAKNRNGERGECLWNFAGERSEITALEDGARAQYRQFRSKPRRKGSDNDL